MFDIAAHAFEECCFLWSQRHRFVNAPHVRLVDLVRLDERLNAHLDALKVAHRTGKLALNAAAANMRTGAEAAGVIFTGVTVTLAESRSVRSGASWLIPAGERLKEIIAAHCWQPEMTDRNLPLALTSAEPSNRVVAIATLGNRGEDPGLALIAALTDPSPLVRARACRATGQLGRIDLLSQLTAADDPDPECRFWAASAAARMGATKPLSTLADIAWNNGPHATSALDTLLRRLDVPAANAWLREFAKLPNRQRDLIRACGVIGDPLYVPWLINLMKSHSTARLAGESFSMITGLDLAFRDLDHRPPPDFESGPNDDPADENTALDEDENLVWPAAAGIGQWWAANRGRYQTGTAHLLGQPKHSADWPLALSDGFQRQRRAAALEMAIRQPSLPMFEVRAQGLLQRQRIDRARGPT